MFKPQKNILRQPKIFTPQDIGYSSQSAPNKKNSSKFIKILIVFIIILGGLVYLFFYSPIFKIKNIIVEGAFLEGSGFEGLMAKNILFINTADVKNEFSQKYPELNIVKIVRGLPDTLKIKLEEHQAKILWQTQDKNYLVDSSGVIFKEIEGVSDLPQVKDNKDLAVVLNRPVVTTNFINFIAELNANFNQETGLIIDRYAVNETIFQIDAVTVLGWKVIFDTTRKAQDQLSDLSRFLKDHQSEVKEYVDVRVEGRVYYK